MSEARDAGLLLRSVEYGDADRIVTFLTRAHGKIAMFARGARRSKRRFAGALEPFQVVSLRFRQRGSNLASLLDTSVSMSRPRLIADYDRITAASYLTELVSESIREHEPLPELFELLDEAYAVLDQPGFPAERAGRLGWIAAFELRLLILAGYAPLLDACATCGRAVDGQASAYRFSPQAGGVQCASCGAGRGVALSAETLRALAASRRADPTEIEPIPLTEEQAAEARRALAFFIRYHLGKELKSARFVETKAASS